MCVEVGNRDRTDRTKRKTREQFISVFENLAAEKLRFPEIAPLNRLDFWYGAS